MSEIWRETPTRGWGPDYTNITVSCPVDLCPWEHEWSDYVRSDYVRLGEIVDVVQSHHRKAHRPECDGLCVSAADIGVGRADQVAYPHPGCPAHAPERECECGQPDRCLSPTHGQISMPEALRIRHRQARP